MRLGLARTRLLVSAATGVIALAVAMGAAPWQFATLIGWDVTALIMAAWVLVAVLPLSPQATAALATREDNSLPASGEPTPPRPSALHWGAGRLP